MYAQTRETTLVAAVSRYFDVVLYLLIFTGFGTLASTGRLDAPTVVVVTSALLYRGYVLARRRQILLSERLTNLLTIVCVGFYIADEFFISRTFLGATVHLVLLVMLVRLFSAQKDRDHYFLAVLSFLMVLAAAVLTVDSTFLFALAGFVLIAVAALILMEMMHSLKKAPVLGGDSRVLHAPRKLSYAIVSVAPMLLILILLGGAGIFFFLPRISAGFMSNQNGSGDISTGFSERVELGRIGQIQRSQSVVMHLQIDGENMGISALKLRGVALNFFDGHSWSNFSAKRALRREVDGSFDLRPPRNQIAAAPGHVVHYRVTMEPFLSDVFFLLSTPQGLQGNYRSVAEDADGDVYNLDAEHLVTRYEADSEFQMISPTRMSSRSTPEAAYPFPIHSYLQYPQLDPRIKPLTEKITANATTPFARASVIETYLRTHYGYTLRLPSSTPADPIADFLFTRRQGHCEYFASAMAIMLRTIGIPSRVVNGFSGGEFNDITSQYVIRASDAHSWVEAYIPGEGWLTFDPTPAGDAQAHSSWDRVMLYMDALSSFWREWIVNYDLGHQLRLAQNATQGSRAVAGRAQFWGRNEYQKILAWARRVQEGVGASVVKWGTRAVVAVSVLLLLISVPRIILLLQRIRLARRPRRSPQVAASIWYERMLRQTAKHGWKKTPAQTPEEFASLISDQRMQHGVLNFSEHYERARFGNSAEDAEQLPQLYEEIKSAR